MKKRRLVLVLATVVALVALGVTAVSADKPIEVDSAGNEIAWEASSTTADGVPCKKIQDGTIVDIKGNPVTVGYDEFGYNYQAHMFNGRYCDYDRVPGGSYCDVNLIMKWNDAWMANTDCDGDSLLDRHYGYDSYIGSGAWLTNHQWGTCELDGKTVKWTYFVKIVAAPADAHTQDGSWYTADDVEIGPVIWGAFAVIQRVSNDACYDEHGLLYKSPAGPGFGQYQP